jgi:hypothetical protein
MAEFGTARALFIDMNAGNTATPRRIILYIVIVCMALSNIRNTHSGISNFHNNSTNLTAQLTAAFGAKHTLFYY